MIYSLVLLPLLLTASIGGYTTISEIFEYQRRQTWCRRGALDLASLSLLNKTQLFQIRFDELVEQAKELEINFNTSRPFADTFEIDWQSAPAANSFFKSSCGFDAGDEILL